MPVIVCSQLSHKFPDAKNKKLMFVLTCNAIIGTAFREVHLLWRVRLYQLQKPLDASSVNNHYFQRISVFALATRIYPIWKGVKGGG